MSLIELTISIDTNNPRDIMNQRELIEIYENLKNHGAKLQPIEVEISSGKATPKSTDLNMIIGAVSISLPVASIATVLTSFLKNYFDARKKRSIKIKRKDGTVIQIDGYSESVTERMIQNLINKKNE